MSVRIFRRLVGVAFAMLFVTGCGDEPLSEAAGQAARYLQACLEKLDRPLSSSLGISDATLAEITVTELSGPEQNDRWPKACTFTRATAVEGGTRELQFLILGANGNDTFQVSGHVRGSADTGAALTAIDAPISMTVTRNGSATTTPLTGSFATVTGQDKKGRVQSLAIVPDGETAAPETLVAEGAPPSFENATAPASGQRAALGTQALRAAPPASVHAIIMARYSDFLRSWRTDDNLGPQSIIPFDVATEDIPLKLLTGVELVPNAKLPDQASVYGPDPNGVRLCGAALMNGYDAWYRAGYNQYGRPLAYFYNGEMWRVRSHYPDTYSFVFRMRNIVPEFRRVRQGLPKNEMDFTCVLPKELRACWRTMPEAWERLRERKRPDENILNPGFLRYERLTRHAVSGLIPNAWAVGRCLQNFDTNAEVTKGREAKQNFRMPLVLTNDGYHGWDVAKDVIPLRVSDIVKNAAFTVYPKKAALLPGGSALKVADVATKAPWKLDYEPFWSETRSPVSYENELTRLNVLGFPVAYSWLYAGAITAGAGGWPAAPGDPTDFGALLTRQLGDVDPVLPVREIQPQLIGDGARALRFASTSNDEFWSFRGFSVASNLELERPPATTLRGLAINRATDLFQPYKDIFVHQPVPARAACPLNQKLRHPLAGTGLGVYAMSFGWAGSAPLGARTEWVTQLQILIPDVDPNELLGAGREFLVGTITDRAVPGLDSKVPPDPLVVERKAYARTMNIRLNGATGFQPTGGTVKVRREDRQTPIGVIRYRVVNFELKDGATQIKGKADFIECSDRTTCAKPLADARNLAAPKADPNVLVAFDVGDGIENGSPVSCIVPPPEETATPTPTPTATSTATATETAVPEETVTESPEPRTTAVPERTKTDTTTEQRATAE